MNYEVNCSSYLGSSFPIHRLCLDIVRGKRAYVRCEFTSVKRFFDTRPICLAGNAAPAAVWSVALLLSVASAAQNPADNWARCEGSDPDASIAACTALVESGKEDNENQAVAFNSRGIAFAMKGQQDSTGYDIRLEDLAADRSLNTKGYPVRWFRIDPARILPTTDESRFGQTVTFYLVPGDADFNHNYLGTTETNERSCTVKPCYPSDEESLEAQPRSRILTADTGKSGK